MVLIQVGMLLLKSKGRYLCEQDSITGRMRVDGTTHTAAATACPNS